MFVADVAHVVLFQHGRQAHELGDENAVVGQHLARVGDEPARVLQVIEHAEGRDHPGLPQSGPPGDGPVGFRRPEVVDDVIGALFQGPDQVVRRLAADGDDPPGRVAGEQGAVVGPDIQHHVSRAETDHPLDGCGDVAQGRPHGLGNPRAVPVMARVHQFHGRRVPELKQGTAVAHDQVQRRLQAFAAVRLVDEIGDVEIPEGVDVVQVFRTAQPAPGVLDHLHRRRRPGGPGTGICGGVIVTHAGIPGPCPRRPWSSPGP